MSFTIGLDLGQTQDYSALALLDAGNGKSLDLRHLRRWDLGVSYPQIVADVGALLARPELRGRCALVVDGTGVGRPVIDLMRDGGLPVRPVCITGGDSEAYDSGWHRVPKRDLVSGVAVALESGRLRIAGGLPLAPVLRNELQNFRAKISLSGHDIYEAWREQDHDDLVLAVALACWWAKRGSPNDRVIGVSKPLLPRGLGN